MTKSLLYKVVYPTEHLGKEQVQEKNSLEGKHMLAFLQQSTKKPNAANNRKAEAAEQESFLKSLKMKHTLLQ